MNILGMLIRIINTINWLIGNLFSWLSLGIVLVCFTVVVQRYIFSTTQLWMQDLYVWLNGAMFTAVAGFTLLKNNHVRVDIFYRPARESTKAVVDLIGTVFFLLPFSWVVWSYGWSFVARSWRFQEGSANIGGMPGLYILKSFILVFSFVIVIQGISMIARSILVLAGRNELVPEDYRYETQQESH